VHAFVYHCPIAFYATLLKLSISTPRFIGVSGTADRAIQGLVGE